MKTYEFSLVLSGVRYDTPKLEDILYEAGCDDGLICGYNEYVTIDFDREESSMEAAVLTAIENIENAALGAKVTSINEGIYVSLSDIARLSNLTRQAIALFNNRKRNKSSVKSFPAPVHNVNCKHSLWRWSEVAQWLSDNGKIDLSLAEDASTLELINLGLMLRAFEYSEQSFTTFFSEFIKNHHN